MGFWLTPVLGDPIEVETEAWAATMDLLDAERALEPGTIERMRSRWDTQVSGWDARRIADALEARRRVASSLTVAPEAGDGVGLPDERWLELFRRFCADSAGFTIGWWQGSPVPPRRAAAETATSDDGRPVADPPRRGWRERVRTLLGPFAVIVFAIVKFLSTIKVALAVLLKVKFAGTALSALVSVGAYALLFGLPFAALFVLLLFVHEMGHVIALRREGVPATAPLFVPFLGAVVGMKGLPRDAWVEAKVGLAGPVLGSLGAAATLGLGAWLDSDLLRAAAYTGFFLNLFNLLPITPLDGGRAVAAIHPSLWLVGLLGIGALFFVHPNVLLLLIVLLGARDAYGRWREFRRGGESRREYYRIRPWQRLAVASTYLGLAGLLVLAMRVAFVET